MACAIVEEFEDDGSLYCILMNWRTKAHLKLAPDDKASPFLVHLLPNHVIFLTNDHSGAPEVAIIHTDTAFSSHWRPIDDRLEDDVVKMSAVGLIYREPVAFSNSSRLRKPWQRELYAYQSPLEEGTYRVWVYLSGYIRSSSKQIAVIGSYHLSLPNKMGDVTTWRQRTAAATVPSRNSSGISYSGHMQQYSFDDQRSILIPGNPTLVGLKLPGGVPYAHISTYSGALTYLADNKILVSHFK
ncbi:hypothetical protein C8R43DRAFT_89012 [Mycena crocata]|nr:hypothetical protein C8R43DRAFT_89012 [Mycena crocata]